MATSTACIQGRLLPFEHTMSPATCCCRCYYFCCCCCYCCADSARCHSKIATHCQCNRFNMNNKNNNNNKYIHMCINSCHPVAVTAAGCLATAEEPKKIIANLNAIECIPAHMRMHADRANSRALWVYEQCAITTTTTTTKR